MMWPTKTSSQMIRLNTQHMAIRNAKKMMTSTKPTAPERSSLANPVSNYEQLLSRNS